MKDNKLIARFMGFESYPFSNKGGKGFDVKLKGIPKNDCNSSYSCAFYGDLEYNIQKILTWDLKYNKSWDWLMPVVNAIENLQMGTNVCVFEVVVVCNTCTIKSQPQWDYHMKIYKEFIEGEGETKLEATYKAVVKFIKWYNNYYKLTKS